VVVRSRWFCYRGANPALAVTTLVYIKSGLWATGVLGNEARLQLEFAACDGNLDAYQNLVI